RRRALDAALAELETGANVPSIEWRRQFSLLLGLERLLSEEEPHLADGAVLSAHQVDALSGTLTALLAEAQRNGSASNGNGNGLTGNGAPAPEAIAPVAAEEALEDEEEENLDLEDDLDEDDNGAIEEEVEYEDEEPQDWQDDEGLDEDVK